ncbi:adenylate/guanylate cyclase domain-containing protein [Pseudodesulfovibrio indicus]|uniref:adenylate/guanylate cyclase domain-containing protein n=1 Tax=Pseudodesulfovibrio indicus TaxID=1716143 RepID=UPI00292FABF5|nr:adenylate/guanylate cyclase domain-containing protein [Pseudodesulfovibrio indicus]
MFRDRITVKVLKGGLKLGLPFVLAVALVGAYFYLSGVSRIEKGLAAEVGVGVEGLESTLTGGILEAVMDMRFLASLAASRDGAGPSGPSNLELCRWFLSHKAGFDRLCYLTGTGSRLFCLTRQPGGAVRVAGESDGTGAVSDCAADMAKLWPGNIHIGTGGQDGPDVKFAISLGDENGEPVNILVLCCSVERLLHRFAEREGCEGRVRTMVLDNNGRRLDAPATGTPLYRQAHPQEWAALSRGERGSFRSGAGIYAYATVVPARVVDRASQPGTGQGGESWRVAAWIPNAELASAKAKLAWNLTLFFLPLAGFLAAGALVLSLLSEQNRLGRDRLLAQHVSRERFVPSEFLNLLGKEHLSDVDLSSSVQREMTILFSDIRSYTKLSEHLAPAQVFELLNDYFSSIDTAITARHGFIDKFIGDAVMALFTGSAEDALRAAIAMRGRIDKFNRKQREAGRPEILTGVGLHRGEVTLGSVGTMRRMQTTAIGDAVNLAARLESATKIFQVAIILSDSLYDQLKDPSQFRLRHIDTVRVKGKNRPVRIYESYDADGDGLAECKNATLEQFERAMTLYAQGDFDGALELFSLCAEACPEDTIPPIYIKRCNTMKRVPPGDGWTGISTL